MFIFIFITKLFKKWLFGLAFIFLISIFPIHITYSATPKKQINSTTKPVYYQVIKVIDGDTIQVKIGQKIETIRLIGINTPETQDPRKPIECFGKEASAKAKELLNKQWVTIESDPTQSNRDKYNRLLRYVFRKDGLFFNKWMIENGYAFEYTYGLPYKYQKEFKQAEEIAQRNKKGLWADNVCRTNNTPAPSPKLTNNQDCYCENDKYNCSNFKTQKEAQRVFDCCMQKVGRDIHQLDRDKDDVACEALP